MNKKVNQSFYFLFAILLIPLHLFHVTLIQRLSSLNEVLFFIHAFVQVLAEVSFMILLAIIVKRYAYRWVYYSFIAISFVFFITHFVDFFLVRMMDLPFWFTLQMVFNESWENFVELLQLTGISLSIWGLIALAGLLMIFSIPVFLYRFLEKTNWAKSLRFTHKQLWKILLFPPCFLFVCDLAIIPGNG